jgi:hypothetical protein
MRFNLLPDPKFFSQASALEDRVLSAVNLVNPDTFPDFAGKVAIAALEQAFRAAGADEGRDGLRAIPFFSPRLWRPND